MNFIHWLSVCTPFMITTLAQKKTYINTYTIMNCDLSRCIKIRFQLAMIYNYETLIQICVNKLYIMKYWLYLCNSSLYFFKVYLVSIINLGSIYCQPQWYHKIFLNWTLQRYIVGKTCCRRCRKRIFCESVFIKLITTHFCVIALIYIFLSQKGKRKKFRK